MKPPVRIAPYLHFMDDKFALKAANELYGVTPHKNSTFIVTMGIKQSDLSYYTLAYSMDRSPS